MTTVVPEILELEEHIPLRRPAAAIPDGVAHHVYRAYEDQVLVDVPSFKNGNQWVFTSQGWVGYLPLEGEWGIRLLPKTPIGNLIRMLEYAYQLDSVRFHEQISPSDSLEDFFSQLAGVLSRRVLDRCRRGLYRAYVSREEELPFLRGRIAVYERAKKPWHPRLPCQFEEHTADIPDNQILTWTLGTILRSGVCRPDVTSSVRQAYQTVLHATELIPFQSSDCSGRRYHALNDDYEPMHAICRFFLDNASPGHLSGSHTTLPFVVQMHRVFEKFVAAWLEEHLPDRYRIEEQVDVRIGQQGGLRFVIDLVLYDTANNQPIAVLDTKYKVPDHPSESDFSQVVTYAKLKGCTEAILIYPSKLPRALSVQLTDVRVRSMTFGIGGDLEEAGKAFLRQLPLADSAVPHLAGAK